jgi:hypothetical protein
VPIAKGHATPRRSKKLTLPVNSQHVMVGGGDQLYCDPLTKEPEIAPWINESDNSKKIAAPLTAEMETALHRFFFNW